MKILSHHPFSLYNNSGGGRILRRLYEGNESQVSSLTIGAKRSAPVIGDIEEKVVYLRPFFRSWMPGKVRNWVGWMRAYGFRSINEKKIRKAAAKIQFDVLHLVDHGWFSSILCDDSLLSGRILWVSFHDHFLTTGSTFSNTNKLWNNANRRLVISNEMGNEYNRLFGHKSFEIITDGVLINEISEPITEYPSIIKVYFAGSLHASYLPLFEVLANSLDILSKEGLKIKLILRGTPFMKFLDQSSFEVEYRPFTTDNDELKQELDTSTILYLPIKFQPANFYLYSLSTKMVGYLGARGSILYHGPDDSAAINLLNEHKSAVSCYTLNTADMVDSLRNILSVYGKVSYNAKSLAKNHFDFQKIKGRFWERN
jgi:hypothetical protein